jgi:hypothetical protein
MHAIRSQNTNLLIFGDSTQIKGSQKPPHMSISESQARRYSGIQTSAMDEATAAAACVWCESSRRKRPNLRTATDITGTITSASTVQIATNEIDLILCKGFTQN